MLSRVLPGVLVAARRGSCVALAALLLLGLAATGASAALPAGFTDSSVITGRINPTTVQFAPDGHVFVAEKSGKIWLYSSLSDTSPTLFADLSGRVDDYWDRGLLGLAIPPTYP